MAIKYDDKDVIKKLNKIDENIQKKAEELVDKINSQKDVNG